MDLRQASYSYTLCHVFGMGARHVRRNRAALAAATFLLAAAWPTSAGAESFPPDWPYLMPFASVSGSCTAPPGMASFASMPQTQDHPDVMIRTQTHGAAGSITAAGDTQTFAAGDTVWRPYAGGVAAGGTGSGTVTCPAGDTPFGADFFDNPGVGKYLNGARTFTGAGQSDAFRVAVPTTNPYMVEVSVDQGAITVTSESSSGRRSETFTENRNFALGTLSPGTTLLTVAPEPGPQARYHLRLVRAPLQLYDLGRDRSAVQPGQSITQKFSFDGPATVTAVVLRVPSRGESVRTILRDEHFEPGLHAIRWDGLDDAGQPLPDGIYSLSIRYRDSDGVADDFSRRFGVDHLAPTVALVSTDVVGQGTPIALSVLDRGTGVKAAVLNVDGHRVARLRARSTRIAYRPRGGWRVGRHTVAVTASDRAGNTRRFRARVSRRR